MSIDPFKLVEQGYEIFPLRITNQLTDEKELHFLTPEPWDEAASNDPAQISQWVAKHGKRITDWGMPTGHRNGFATVDIDSDDGEQYWSALWLPEGKEVATPRGGMHVHYSLEGVDADIKTTRGKSKSGIHPDIDTRGEGGFVVAYTDDMTGIPVLPEAVLEVLPEKQVYSSYQPPADAAPEPLRDPVGISGQGGEELLQVSPPEARVIAGLTDILDELPRPWHKGAGYHDAQFLVACGLNRIANSPFYRTDRAAAHKIFLKHAPLRDAADAEKRDKRWSDAVEMTTGQWFDPPTDVPIRLDANEALDTLVVTSVLDRLFWESKNVGDVKDLIREIREQGGTRQVAYSISYECAAMKKFRSKNDGKSSSTWGYVKDIYGDYDEQGETEVPRDATPPAPVVPRESPSSAAIDVSEYATPALDSSGDEAERAREESKPQVVVENGEEVIKPGSGTSERLLTPEEAEIARRTPNVIDRYIMVAEEILAEPNMPLHYANAWIWLSCSIGDRADIFLENGRMPLNLWGMPLAQTAAGKGDAKNLYHAHIDATRRGGFADVNAGSNASAEGLTEFIAEREDKVTLFHKDESRSLLEGMHAENSYEKRMMDLALDLYDGKVNRNLRVNNAKEGVGASVRTVFNVWLQTTWQGAIGSLTQNDIETGFLGRFIVAIGDAPKITRDSLRLNFASEYQIKNDNVHPMVASIAEGIQGTLGNTRGLTIGVDSEEVGERYIDMCEQILAIASKSEHAEHLRGVMLRIGRNIFKAAALLALSEGRTKVTMPDLLVAIKSGQYWVRDALRVVDAISTSGYRKLIQDVVKLCIASPRSRNQLLRAFPNLSSREIMEAVERAEQEALIKKSESGKNWIACE